MTVVNPLHQLAEAGQSVWLDFLSRELVTSKKLDRLALEDRVAGVTSNPTIFHRAIAGSSDYDEDLAAALARGVSSPLDLFYELALSDVRMAADVLRPVYDATGGRDGFVSFELEPRMAHDPIGSVEAAKAIVARLNRPNVMIKVPATSVASLAVEDLTAAGINVNITLLFSIKRYEAVLEAYLAGLERRLDTGRPIDTIASVASFFVSRIDAVVDARLPEGSPLRGRIAIANARAAYGRFADTLSGRRWERLARAGASPQRLLWASTGTKNPAYSDVVYVEELVAPQTVTTMPEATLDAFRDHGQVRPRVVIDGVEEATATLASLAAHGIDLPAIAEELLEDGLAAFETDLALVLGTLEGKRDELLPRPIC